VIGKSRASDCVAFFIKPRYKSFVPKKYCVWYPLDSMMYCFCFFNAAQRWAGDSPAADELAVNPTWSVTHE
jgi:hypothetical protein